MLAADPARSALSVGPHTGPSDLDAPTWVFPASDPGLGLRLGADGPVDIDWVADAGPVVIGDLVIAVASQDSSGTPARLWAVDRSDGTARWWADLPDAVLDSWSTPAIDPVNATVLYGIGRPTAALGGVVQARRLTDGSLVWEAELEKDVVNASVLVTSDRGPADRAFITDYEGFFASGPGSRLSCINVDPFDATLNPHQPGDVVWAAPLDAAASGATPAYDGERVYVVSAGDFGPAGGIAHAFDASADDADDALVWRTRVPGNDAFFGGVTVAADSLFAATYAFGGVGNSARLVKIDARDGAIVWHTPANRTDSIPVVMPDGRIALSTGIAGFGSVPTLQLFADGGGAASIVDDSAAATWLDDGDGVLEPGEFETFGGYTHQPHAVSMHPVTGGPVAFVGSIAEPAGAGLFAGYDRLAMLDLSLPFGAPGWVISSSLEGGSSPAIVGVAAYSIGRSGLAAFGDYCPGDVDLSGDADFFDVLEHLRSFDAGEAAADETLDGAITPADTERVVARVDAGCDAGRGGGR